MDIVMPDMGGIEAVREICKTRSRGEDPDVQRDGAAGAGRRGDPGGREGLRGEAVPAPSRARGGPARLWAERVDVSKYAALFLAESREHLSSCQSAGCSSWERDPAPTGRPSAASPYRSTRSRAWAPPWGSPAWRSWLTGMESLLDALRHGQVTGRRTFQSCSVRSMPWARRSKAPPLVARPWRTRVALCGRWTRRRAGSRRAARRRSRSRAEAATPPRRRAHGRAARPLGRRW